MKHPRHSPRAHFRPALLASLIGAALAPQGSWALDLATSPPSTEGGTVSRRPYIAPNVIFSLDNSEFTKKQTVTVGGKTVSAADAMRNMVSQAIQDTAALPDGSIRFTWQTMANGCNSDAKLGTMQELNAASRKNFADYLQRFDSCSWRSTSQLVSVAAHRYLSAPVTPAGPWAFKPGEQGAPYLGCRRNYHFMLSGKTYSDMFHSGEAIGPQRQSDSKHRLPDDKYYWGVKTSEYNKADQHTKNQFTIYSNDHFNGLGPIADWAFVSWLRLQYFKPKYPPPLDNYGQPIVEKPPAVTLVGELPLPADYVNAPATEIVKNRVTGTSVTLEKYWNPKYNPAIWSHLVTYTFGLGTYGAPRLAFYYPPKPPGGVFNRPPVRHQPVHPTSIAPYGTDGDFAEYATGRYTWSSSDTSYLFWQLPESHTEGSWPADSAQELWHSAINSRGKYYVVHRGNEVADALRTVVAQAESDFGGSASAAAGTISPKSGTTAPGGSEAAVLSGAATSGGNIARNAVQLFKSYYQRAGWSGWITGETLKTDATDTVKTPAIADWSGQTTAQRLDGTDSNRRVILGWRDANGGMAAAGVPFRWASDGRYLSTAHKAALAGTDNRGEERLNYLRGDRSAENAAAAAGPLRKRQSVHGDIVNSQIWFAGAPASAYPLPGYGAFYAARATRTPMIYVGANDGMLHGFSAQDGTEKIAYVPRGVVPQLASLTAQNYDANHRYFVDGSPMTGDVNLASGSTSTDWRTMLVGTLGAGGKGFFVLDVTDPASFSESNAATLVAMDKTLSATETLNCAATAPAGGQTSCLQVPEADLGHITAAPVRHDGNPLRATQITRMNDNRWAVVLGNGYNSTNERPVLLVQYLDGAKELLRIPATGSTATRAHANTTDNGLSAPRLVDLDADGRPDVAYAGDNKGNVWKFILASSDSRQWAVAFGGSPLYTALGPAGPATAGGGRTVPQPISTAPIVRANDRMKTVGSGSQATTLAVGGMMVAFGTGRNVASSDPADTAVQSLYGVLDNTRYAYTGTGDGKRLAVLQACQSCDNGNAVASAAAVGTGVTHLARQSIGSTPVSGADGRQFWTVDPPTSSATTQTSVNWATQKGWYLDLPVQGERLLKPIEFYDSTNLLAVYSQVPSSMRSSTATSKAAPTTDGSELCTAETVTVTGSPEQQYLTVINAVDGARPRVQLMDANNDGLFNATDANVSRVSLVEGVQVAVDTANDSKAVINSNARIDKFARPPSVVLRPSWRHLQ